MDSIFLGMQIGCLVVFCVGLAIAVLGFGGTIRLNLGRYGLIAGGLGAVVTILGAICLIGATGLLQ